MTKKLAIILHSGTMDQLYCAFILGSTAVSMDWEVHIYFTFWGLRMLKKGEMERAGLPATYKELEEDLEDRLEEMDYPSPYEMLERMNESGKLTIYACTPSMKMFNISEDELIPLVDKMAGAATFLDEAQNADITLKI